MSIEKKQLAVDPFFFSIFQLSFMIFHSYHNLCAVDIRSATLGKRWSHLLQLIHLIQLCSKMRSPLCIGFFLSTCNFPIRINSICIKLCTKNPWRLPVLGCSLPFACLRSHVVWPHVLSWIYVNWFQLQHSDSSEARRRISSNSSRRTYFGWVPQLILGFSRNPKWIG